MLKTAAVISFNCWRQNKTSNMKYRKEKIIYKIIFRLYDYEVDKKCKYNILQREK